MFTLQLTKVGWELFSANYISYNIIIICLNCVSSVSFLRVHIRLSSFAELLQEGHSRCLINICGINLCKTSSLSTDELSHGCYKMSSSSLLSSLLYMNFQLIFSDLSSSSLLQIQIFVRENMTKFSKFSKISD